MMGRRVVVFGAVLAMLLLAASPAVLADTGEAKWGIKLDVDLGKEFNSYLDVGMELMVSQMRLSLERSTDRFSIDSHYSSLSGNLKAAVAMEKRGNELSYEGGSFLDTSLNMGINGTFPYADTVDELASYDNASDMPARNIHSSISLISKEKSIFNGNIRMDDEGRISSMNMKSSEEMNMRVIGKNIPLSVLIYSYAKSIGTRYNYTSIYLTFRYDSSNSTEIRFDVYGGSALNPAYFTSDDPQLNINYVDRNNDSKIDSGDMLIISTSPEHMSYIENESAEIIYTYKGEQHNLELSECCGAWRLDNLYIFDSETSMDPEMQEIINETKDLPVYQDFDFTVHITYNESVNNVFSPPMVVSKATSYSYNVTTTGTYSGTIDITGLPPEYEKILKKILKKDFPIRIEDIDTKSNSFNHGQIDMSHTSYLHMTSEKTDYHGEQVEKMVLYSGYSGAMPSASSIYFYYSPSKGFIVGAGASMGIKSFETEPTSYEEAKQEISEIRSSDTSVETSPGLPVLPIALLLAAVIAMVGIGIVLVRRKKPPYNPQTESPTSEEPQYGEEGGMETSSEQEQVF